MKKFDYLIVGQGIAGSLLAIELIKSKKKVCVINNSSYNISSRVAAGLYNPITGRKMVKTWLADDLFDLIESYYIELENLLGTKFLHEIPIYRPFFNVEEQNDWIGAPEDPNFKNFVSSTFQKSTEIPGVLDPYGGIMLKRTGYLDIPKLIEISRSFISDKGMYIDELFAFDRMTSSADYISYGQITAENVIFCEGFSAKPNPYFPELKFRPVKGEIIDISLDFKLDVIVNRGVFMLPRKEFVRVGSTYDNKDLTLENTENGIEVIKEKLSNIFSGSYRIINKYVGIRPATFDRRPYIGMSNNSKHIGIFNGFGTKGVSLVPFFAKLFVQKLGGKGNLPEEVRLNR